MLFFDFTSKRPMNPSFLLSEVEKHVRDLLSIQEKRPFHNFNHTQHVVQKCDELATYYKVSEEDKEALLTAAWFHDTGYLYGRINHEDAGIKIASDFLNSVNANPEFINKVNELILVTKLPSKPVTLLQKIVCDADLHHLASSEYLDWSNRLRLEVQLSGNFIDEHTWTKENISFFKGHYYFTEYAITFWESQKQRNLQALNDFLTTSYGSSLSN